MNLIIDQHTLLRLVSIFMILWCVYSSISMADQSTDGVDEPKTILSFPVFDFPYNTSDGYTFPSMSQSLNAAKSMYQFSHHYFENTELTILQKRASIIGFDFIATYLPLGDAWLHEEWHRAVMGQYGIHSYNEVYDFKFFSATIAVSAVSDEDLIQLKQEHPADMVRLHSAGIESQYELNLALEKDLFFYRSPTWDYATIWFNYLNNLGYLRLCSSRESDTLTDGMLSNENQNISQRDFTGLDCNAWVYDLFRPEEPYTARGIHPSGVGIDRYISYSKLTVEERDYLKLQTRLSYLNLIDPFLFGKTHFETVTDNGEMFYWNSSVRHHLTPFGYNIGINIFTMTNKLKMFATINQFSNKQRKFPGIDASLLRKPVLWFNSRLQVSLRAVLWQQPKRLQFDEYQAEPGGMLSVTTHHKTDNNGEYYLQLDSKSAGWVPGVTELGYETSLKFGLSYLLK